MAIKRVILCKDCPRSHAGDKSERFVYCDYWDTIFGKHEHCSKGDYFKRTKWQKREFGYIQEGETNED